MVFKFVRHSTFSFLGGYTVTSFYNETIRNHKKNNNTKLGGGIEAALTSAARQQKLRQNNLTFSDDIRAVITGYEMPCAAALLCMVIAGGVFATVGACFSFGVEGPHGPENYVRLKQAVKEVLPSQGEVKELAEDAAAVIQPYAEDAIDAAKDAVVQNSRQ